MRRAYDRLLHELLRQFPCVAIIGPRQCGKTTLLEELSASWKRLDMEKAADYDLLARDPDLFFRLNAGPVALDEAQVLPPLFPALRVAIDRERGRKGRFVITGSSSPRLIHSISETLAGRVATIEMAPFSCAETQGRLDHPLLEALEARVGAKEMVQRLSPRLDILQVHQRWFWGGYPEPWLSKDLSFRKRWMAEYFRNHIERDVAHLFPGLNTQRFRTFLGLLSGLSGGIVNYAETARALGVSAPTAREYFEIADGTFLWRVIPPYVKGSLKRIVKHPKGYLRDTGLFHFLLRLPDLDALLTHPRAGFSWESLVTEEILRGFAARGTSVDAFYYRTAAGAEVDLVLEGDFGLVPIEIKYSQTVDERRLRSLADFVAEKRCRLGLVVNNAEAPRMITERIVGIPFSCL